MTSVKKLAASQKDAFLEAHTFFSNPTHDKHFNDMVQSLASLQSWLEYFIVPTSFGSDVRNFFVEAVNDSIIAYSQARVGTWRPALQCLRSTLENALVFLYYKDHPVELQLWTQQQHRMGFAELCTYLKAHPLLLKFDHQSETGIVVLGEIYSELSRAVHGSVTFMRMTAKAPKEELPSMHIHSPAELSRFTGLVKTLVEYLNILFVAMFRESLTGTSLPLLRSAIAGAIADKRRKNVKKVFGVTLH